MDSPACPVLQSCTDQVNDLKTTFQMVDKKFRRTCHHIRVLNRRIEAVQIRYDRAVKTGNKRFQYTYTIQLTTLKAMRSMYEEYAEWKVDEKEDLDRQIEIRLTFLSFDCNSEDTDNEGMVF